jgi:uncharacterized protein
MLTLAGYFATVLIGLSLGLIGGGGSILTVPVLVYLFCIEPHLATSYSLFVVGVSSLIGSTGYVRNKLVDFKAVSWFGIPSLIMVFATRKFILPFLPEEWTLLGLSLHRDRIIMLLFSVLMSAAAYSMIRKPKVIYHARFERAQEYGNPLLILQGIGVGCISGLVGAGGGFLIIPALVILAKLPMKKAIGTSLTIITMNCSIGFLGDLGHYQINWLFLCSITLISSLGIWIGNYFSSKIAGRNLKPVFGWLVVVIVIYTLIQELWLKHSY